MKKLIRIGIVGVVIAILFLAGSIRPIDTANAQTLVQDFTVVLSSSWSIKGTYYMAQNNTELIVIIPGGLLFATSFSSWLFINDTGPTDFATDLALSGFDVAVIQSGYFATSSGFEVGSIITALSNIHAVSDVFLIGMSAGGAVVASYVTSQPHDTLVRGAVVLDAPLAWGNGWDGWDGEPINWAHNGLPNAAFRAENLTIPTLLIYGENDTICPAHRHAGAWIGRAPLNLTDVELYSYDHNPWSSETDPEVRNQVEQRIIECIATPIPEMPYPLLALILILLATVLIRRREANHGR